MFVGCDLHQEPVQKASLPIAISLPIEPTATRNHIAPRRVMGDPGKSEILEFPNYLYIFILTYKDDTWKMFDIIEDHITDNEEWHPTHYSGILYTEGDSIFQYSKRYNLLLDGKEVQGRTYAIASPVPLVFNKTLNLSSIRTLDDLLDLTIDISDPDTKENLQNIYTTPYNYNWPATSKYYGTFENDVNSNVALLDLQLYHIAAKVDITWNVADAVRINKEDPSAAVRLTGMKAKNLFNGNAYCFKPMENSSGATPVSSGEEITIVQATDEGLWWEGRSYFYTIPYTTTADGKEDYFPLQMELETNGSGDIYEPTIYLEIDKSSPFVPWLRANFNLTAPLTAGSAEKVVDN